MDWFYRLPIPLLFFGIMATFVGITLGGMLLFTPVRARLQARFQRSSDQAAYFGTQIWLAYTLILSLTAVGAWSEFRRRVARGSSRTILIRRRQRRLAGVCRA